MNVDISETIKARELGSIFLCFVPQGKFVTNISSTTTLTPSNRAIVVPTVLVIE